MGEVRGLKGPEERQLAAGRGRPADVASGDWRGRRCLQRRFLLCRQGGQSGGLSEFSRTFRIGRFVGTGWSRSYGVRRPAGCLVRSPPMLPIPCRMRRSVRPWHRVPGRFPYTLWRVLRSVNCSKGAANWLAWYAQRGTAIDFAEYGSPAMRITASVPPGRDILLVHNCCVTQEDVERIEAHFTGRVTWVLCPCSNRYISRLSPPVGLLRGKGVRIAVGTDSLASNTALDMVAELRALGDVPLEARSLGLPGTERRRWAWRSGWADSRPVPGRVRCC